MVDFLRDGKAWSKGQGLGITTKPIPHPTAPMHSATVITTRRGKTLTCPANVGSGIAPTKWCSIWLHCRFLAELDSSLRARAFMYRQTAGLLGIVPLSCLWWSCFLLAIVGSIPATCLIGSCSALHSGICDAVRGPSMESSTEYCRLLCMGNRMSCSSRGLWQACGQFARNAPQRGTVGFYRCIGATMQSSVARAPSRSTNSPS